MKGENKFNITIPTASIATKRIVKDILSNVSEFLFEIRRLTNNK